MHFLFFHCRRAGGLKSAGSGMVQKSNKVNQLDTYFAVHEAPKDVIFNNRKKEKKARSAGGTFVFFTPHTKHHPR
jgi:hypothetical protein